MIEILTIINGLVHIGIAYFVYSFVHKYYKILSDVRRVLILFIGAYFLFLGFYKIRVAFLEENVMWAMLHNPLQALIISNISVVLVLILLYQMYICKFKL